MTGFNVVSPQNRDELLTVISSLQDKNFRFGAGCTDLLIELRAEPVEDLTVVNLKQLDDNEFSSIRERRDGLRIGSLTTVHEIAINEKIGNNYPVLSSAAIQLASTQIRRVATVGGNLCTASPAGDISCALYALNAECEVLNTAGDLHTFPISDFFTGVRETCLERDEILRSVFIPHNGNGGKIRSGFIKIGTRRSMECSVVSLAYHILADDTSVVHDANIALGSIAPTIMSASSACDYLTGKSLNKLSVSEKTAFADKVMEYADPISDVRATAWYRKEVLHNISRTLFDN